MLPCTITSGRGKEKVKGKSGVLLYMQASGYGGCYHFRDMMQRAPRQEVCQDKRRVGKGLCAMAA